MHRFFSSTRDAPPAGPDSGDAELAAVAAGKVEALRILHRRHAPWSRPSGAPCTRSRARA